MTDLKSPVLIWTKGILFLFLGILASLLLLLDSPDVKVVVLLATAIWAFCRAYYFAFYVIEHYVDPEYHFSGIFSFLRYVISQRNSDRHRMTSDDANTGPMSQKPRLLR